MDIVQLALEERWLAVHGRTAQARKRYRFRLLLTLREMSRAKFEEYMAALAEEENDDRQHQA